MEWCVESLRAIQQNKHVGDDNTNNNDEWYNINSDIYTIEATELQMGKRARTPGERWKSCGSRRSSWETPP